MRGPAPIPRGRHLRSAFVLPLAQWPREQRDATAGSGSSVDERAGHAAPAFARSFGEFAPTSPARACIASGSNLFGSSGDLALSGPVCDIVAPDPGGGDLERLLEKMPRSKGATLETCPSGWRLEPDRANRHATRAHARASRPSEGRALPVVGSPRFGLREAEQSPSCRGAAAQGRRSVDRLPLRLGYARERSCPGR